MTCFVRQRISKEVQIVLSGSLLLADGLRNDVQVVRGKGRVAQRLSGSLLTPEIEGRDAAQKRVRASVSTKRASLNHCKVDVTAPRGPLRKLASC